MCYIFTSVLPVMHRAPTFPSPTARDRRPRALWGRLAVCALAVLLVVAPIRAQQEQPLRVVPLVRGDQVLVSFELTDGVTDELRAAIRSGLRTSFTYTVDLRLDVPAWVDRTISTATVTNSVEYDNLTRQHTVSRQVDGRVEEVRVTDDEDVVREWMTRLVRLPLFSTSLLEPNREYYVRVSASARPSNGSFLWPFGSGPSAQARFTFIR
jgi:hypothetical protein